MRILFFLIFLQTAHNTFCQSNIFDCKKGDTIKYVAFRVNEPSADSVGYMLDYEKLFLIVNKNTNKHVWISEYDVDDASFNSFVTSYKISKTKKNIKIVSTNKKKIRSLLFFFIEKGIKLETNSEKMPTGSFQKWGVDYNYKSNPGKVFITTKFGGINAIWMYNPGGGLDGDNEFVIYSPGIGVIMSYRFPSEGVYTIRGYRLINNNSQH